MSGAAARVVVFAALGIPMAAIAAASVEQVDAAQVRALLAMKSPCCVIDARAASERRKVEIGHALVYRKGLRINPTGVVVVIADSDAKAQAVGQALARTSGATRVVAVKGGASTWLSAQRETIGSAAHAPSFIIPRNTCEQGSPLQTLPAERE
jgi:hypothetical protein